MQELWIAALDWDDELPPEHSEKWNDYCERIPELQAISVPRWNHLESNKTPCELHGFADASTRAYAAVVYLRTTNEKNEVKISLLTAKSKVAPIKTISVPRLELCAAVLLAKLLEFVQKATKLQSCTTYTWTDSTVVEATPIGVAHVHGQSGRNNTYTGFQTSPGDTYPRRKTLLIVRLVV